MRILVVEDEKRIADFLTRGLQGAGYAVDAAPNGATALEFIHATDYDLIILDIRMPHLNGFEVSRELRKVEPNARIWFLTAFEIYKREFDKLFPDLRIQRFIHKPITASNLATLVRKEFETVII